MLRKILLPTIFVVLGYGFWVSPDFKEIAAGVAIFLFGMLSLEEGFKAFTGGILERILQRTTNRLWKSLSFGIVSTTVMQSSSLVSVITISFLSAGLIGLASGIGIIFGANLGTTTGAWLVAGFGLKVKISAYAMPMLVFGIILVFQKSKSLRGAGYILAGLGFLFLGIHHMKEGFEAFKDAIDLAAYAMPGLKGLLVYTLLGAAATVVMQSSHATLVLIITALAAQQISYENALALAIGANVGTTITAILGAMSSNVQGRRLAGAHLIFNVTTGLVAIIFIQQFLLAVNGVSDRLGIAEDDYTMKLAVFHTLFNLAGIIIMLPFTGQLVSLLERLLKKRERKVEEPLFLNEAAMELPESAMQAIRNEIGHLFENAHELIISALNLDPQKLRTSEDLKQLIETTPEVKKIDIDAIYERRIKTIYSAIIAYISEVQSTASEHFGEELYQLRQASRNIVEAVKDTKHLQKNLVRYTKSTNPQIQDQYNNLRLQLAVVLSELAAAKDDEEDETSLLSLDSVQLVLEESDVIANGELDRLIRDDAISAEMATSLMNDSAYAYDVAGNLIDMARVLFGPMQKELRDVESELMLSEEELDEIISSGDSDNHN
ncbi:MAG: sodium:phosphate symporter [gamma proteobacterium symbiont of Stewartia floridana]|nr:Na/Pi cotransporter family protein [Candidatus Thiodiazotropha taylori]RLW51609.1 MAG: sodium:phosphate symporter [gamma proteobacterium symbiont of Stewartia floridana]RLW62060.1 MAG: sodium:phosphate symporter [gamma proteobacterium symbiont of Stewartia floridana]RLW65101.1 MAG: sodium:phosphate symporter [gamma proteobacterium symbiont of Stewartia floridana]RLW67104.1 MAG: sodium:phosphate symporter [gamma proteobacterium symbiont of Stewartia floridana]